MNGLVNSFIVLLSRDFSQSFNKILCSCHTINIYFGQVDKCLCMRCCIRQFHPPFHLSLRKTAPGTLQHPSLVVITPLFMVLCDATLCRFTPNAKEGREKHTHTHTQTNLSWAWCFRKSDTHTNTQTKRHSAMRQHRPLDSAFHRPKARRRYLVVRPVSRLICAFTVFGCMRGENRGI